MKPGFALSLSIEGISLLHRAEGGWRSVGNVPVDTADLNGAMHKLRERALELADDLRCKVIIPNDQIRYLSVETGDQPDDERQFLIEAEVATATPYELDKLVFDTVDEGSRTYVAAVTRMTLIEATGFAVQYGFEPVSYVAIPEPEEFPGEPFFGPSSAAAQLTGADAVEPDGIAIVVIGDAELPEDEQISEEEVSDEEQTEEVSDTETEEIEEHADEQADEAPLPGFSSCRRPTLDESPAPPVTPEPITETEAPTTAPLRAEKAVDFAESSADDPAPPTAEIHPIAEPSKAPVFAAPTIPGVDPRDEAERLTIFGARGQLSHRSKYRYPALAASFVTVLAVVGWAALGPSDVEEPVGSDIALEDTAEATPVLSEPDTQQDVAALPGLSDTDNAVLDALNVAPQPVEQLDFDPEQEEALYAATGIASDAPQTPEAPTIIPVDDVYVASIDRTDLSQDALALPLAQEFDTDQPIDRIGVPGVAGAEYALDAQGLVEPTPEGTLNPDGVMVYLGRPSVVPPPVPVRFETEPEVDAAQDRLAELRPRTRPETLVEQNERLRLGGRSLEELASVRPKLRPASAQSRQVAAAASTPAVLVSPKPKRRPANLAVAVAAAAAANNRNLGSTAGLSGSSSSDESGTFAPRAVKPKAPSSASVARQATLDNAINLRRINLIGVYGTPANRRALIRLPSGRYKKVKVGDRVDGGRVVAIGDSELRYQKGKRNLTLKMPSS
ncbi:MAG: hypothetical protein AB3N22_02485 [Ruegeria sp.]